MKRFRLVHIALSLVLSLLIVSLGTGIALVHCSHSGATKLLSMAYVTTDKGNVDDCMPQSDCKPQSGCMKQSSCMQVMVAKLSPYNVFSAPVHDFSQTPLTVPALPQSFLAYWQSPERLSLPLVSTSTTIDKPPRAYLRQLRILII